MFEPDTSCTCSVTYVLCCTSTRFRVTGMSRGVGAAIIRILGFNTSSQQLVHHRVFAVAVRAQKDSLTTVEITITPKKTTAKTPPRAYFGRPQAFEARMVFSQSCGDAYCSNFGGPLRPKLGLVRLGKTSVVIRTFFRSTFFQNVELFPLKCSRSQFSDQNVFEWMVLV